MPCPWCKHFDLDQGPAAVASVEGEGMALFGVSGLVGAGLPTISVTIRSVFEIVGREEEVGSLYAFIVDAGGPPAALVLEGEAGIGKSTLWLAGVEHARTRGLRVFSSRPAEAERSLAHVGLGDLFTDVLDAVLPALTAPKRRALEVALLREDASAEPVGDRALAETLHDVLQI